MDKKKYTPTKQEIAEIHDKLAPVEKDPNELLKTFLKDNNLVLNVSAISDDNSFVAGRGFVLTEKPLLVISVKYK